MANCACGRCVLNVTFDDPFAAMDREHLESLGFIARIRAMKAAGKQISPENLGEVRAPYPEDKIGVIVVGAYADMELVDANPLEDITLIGGNEKWFDAEPRPFGKGIDTIRIIMKGGKIYKNTLYPSLQTGRMDY